MNKLKLALLSSLLVASAAVFPTKAQEFKPLTKFDLVCTESQLATKGPLLELRGADGVQYVGDRVLRILADGVDSVYVMPENSLCMVVTRNSEDNNNND